MGCLLPSNAFDKVVDVNDSTRCVECCELNLSCGSICESSTPISNNNSVDINNNTTKLTDTNIYTNTNNINNINIINNINSDNINNDSKSPMMSSVDRLRRLERDLNSFALDDTISNVMINDDEYDNNINMSCKSPILYTPIKCNKNTNITNIDDNNKTDILNNIYTRFDEPHVNISDDETKNPILASSIRRNYNINNADIRRSEKILGNSRCWTDRYDINNTDIFDDSESLTLSPIRSLTSMLSSSQLDNDSILLNSNKRNYDYYNNNQQTYSLNVTPTRSYTKSTNRYTDNYDINNKSVDINNNTTKFTDTNNNTFDMFNNINIMNMINKDYNPMYNVILNKDEICKCKLSNDLEMLYKHFKNLCTILKRGSMRNDQPYFRIIQMLVQRMSRKSFTLDNLRQMLWLAPNLINVRWVLINDNIRKKYTAEYKDSTDKIYDLSIKLYKPNNTNINNNYDYCNTTNDYEKVCYRFKNILCCWSLKCEYDGLVGFEIPYYKIPENKIKSNISTPRRDSVSIRIDETPTRSIVRTGMYNYLNTTPIKSYNNTFDISNNITKSYDRSYTKSFDNLNKFKSSQNSDDMLLSSNKRIKINDVSMSPMSEELLNTPGMQRIRENARKISIQNKMIIDNSNDLKYWIDMRWFTKMLLELMTKDNNSYRLDYIVDFVSKYGSRKVTQDQVTKWIDSLYDIDPNVLQKSISKFEDYSTIITFNKSSSLNNAIDHINQQIKILQSV